LAEWAVKLGVQKEKIIVVPNGVDLQNFKFPIPSLKIVELKQELNLKCDDKVLITTSRLVLKNAVDDVIRSLQFLPDM